MLQHSVRVLTFGIVYAKPVDIYPSQISQTSLLLWEMNKSPETKPW